MTTNPAVEYCADVIVDTVESNGAALERYFENQLTQLQLSTIHLMHLRETVNEEFTEESVSEIKQQLDPLIREWVAKVLEALK
jgi:hypothetical protein